MLFNIILTVVKFGMENAEYVINIFINLIKSNP